MIEVSTPDGGTAEFPDGTAADVMRNALRAKFGGGPAKGVADEMKKYGAMSAGDVATSAVKAIPGSAAGVVKGMAQAVMHPGETLGTIAAIGGGVLQKLGIFEGEDAKPYAEVAGKFLMDRYGSGEAIKKSIATDPVGVAMDLSMALTGGGTAAAKVPGAVGKIGEAAATVGRAVDPINLTAKGVRGAGYAADAITGGAVTAKASARSDVARALARDNMTAADAQASGGSVAGRDATLADVGGENTRGLVERVAQTPGAGRTIVTPFLTGRQEAQAARISTDLSDLTGSKRTAFQAVSQTITERAKAAQPLYQTALQAGDKEIWSPGLERLTGSPTIKSSMQGAVRIWQDNAVADGFGAMNPGATVERGGLLKFSGGQVPVFPNLQFWDYTKRLLDDKISSAKRAGQNQKVRTLTQLAGNLRKELDSVVPEYAAARQAWSGPSAYLDAIETGRDILSRTVSHEEFTANFSGLSKVEQDGVREGAVSSIVARMDIDPAKLGDMTKYLRSPGMRKKITAIMPTPQAAAKWDKLLSFEVKSSELVGQSLRGSQTARRLAEMDDAKSIVGDLVMDAFSGSPPIGLLRRLTIGSAKKIRDTIRSKTDKEIARIMTSPAALRDLPKTIGGGVIPRSPLLLKQPPYRALGQSAFQTGRASDQSQQ